YLDQGSGLPRARGAMQQCHLLCPERQAYRVLLTLIQPSVSEGRLHLLPENGFLGAKEQLTQGRELGFDEEGLQGRRTSFKGYLGCFAVEIECFLLDEAGIVLGNHQAHPRLPAPAHNGSLAL